MYRILIADDDRDLLDTLRDAFIAFGYQVTTAENGQQAWDFFRTEPYDIVLLDVEMPFLNGMEAAKRMKQRRPEVPVILMTAYSHLYHPEDVLSLDIEAFLRKPLNIQELLEVVEKIAGQQSNDHTLPFA
ncbi:MAG TPA: response regulator [Calditrichae bacterium]|nr:response regulator [Calditrichia bacterium]